MNAFDPRLPLIAAQAKGLRRAGKCALLSARR